MTQRLLVTSLGIISYLYISAAEPVPTAGSATAETTDSISGSSITDLEDFTIETQRRLVQSDGAKLTYNVTEDPEASGANILDILRKVPGVTVDAEDNIKVNGQSNFNILMNGHEDPMFKTGDLKTALKSLPAATIKKIEVISEPGAKYEAEGVGGILNIVTDSTHDLSGFVTRIGGWFSNRNYGGYIDAKTKINKVMLGARVSYNNGALFKTYNYSHIEQDYLTSGEKMVSDAKAKTGWDNGNVQLNMSWEPDTLNLITFSTFYNKNSWQQTGRMSRGVYSPNLSTSWSSDYSFTTPGNNKGFGASASYQHNFKREDHNLILSYEYDYGHAKDVGNVYYDSLEGDIPETTDNSLYDYPYSGTKSIGNTISHVLQLDYVNQINKHHLLELGAKGNLNYSRSDSQTLYGKDESTAAEDESQKVNVGQFKEILAAYGSYTGSFDKWNVKAGLRYEHTRMGLRYHVGDYSDFTTYLNDVVPNAAVSYNFTQASALRLAYQMRISRPSIWILDPYVNTLTPGQITYGNPNLKSEKSNNISLSYSNYAGAFSGSAKVSYMFVRNGNNDIIFLDDNGILNTTYSNVGRDQSFITELNADWSITNSLRWSLYLNAQYSYLKAESELLTQKNEGWQYHAQTSLNYTLPCQLRLSGYGGYYTGWIDLQGKGSDGYYYGLSASRSFLKDNALTLSVSASTFLPATKKSYYTQSSETVSMINRTRYKQWGAQSSISYTFGGLKTDVKQTSAVIEKEEINMQKSSK